MGTPRDRWEIVKSLFEAALEEDSLHRSAFLAEQCEDAGVRAEVERLLAEYEQAGSFLSTPVLGCGQPRRLPEGKVLADRFRVLRFIAAGGMGEVYEAEDLELHERVAIKTIRPDILTQPNAVARFKREVHLARKVTHPNVCRIYDLFRHKPEDDREIQETLFVSMEMLHGKTLSERLNQAQRIGTEEALPIVRQMAAALGAAHAVGIVHRDFKPGNVVLVDSPDPQRAVVTDFGLALQPLKSEDGISFSTSAGLLGTPTYMAPEQLEGRPATSSSDIYALGLVIYEIVTGARPFQGDTPMSAAMKRLSEPPAHPRKFEPKLDPVWESVILRCLERDPAKRFLRAEDIGAILAGNQTTLSGRAALRPYSKRLTTSIAALIVVLAMTGAYLYARRPPRLTEKDTVVLADFTNATGDAVFDDTLKTALDISLRQSPFLNLLSDNRVAATLRLMTRPTGTKLTPDVTRDLCQRAGSKAYVVGSIGSLGTQYVLGLKAVNCQSGDLLAEEQATAAKDKVLDVLGETASKLRRKLGESLATVQKFDVPLAEATTSSLDALKAYSLGSRADHEKGKSAALPYQLDAIELDPNFAMGYKVLGDDYYSVGELGRASKFYSKAFELRGHTSEREKLEIAASYYKDVTGQLDKAGQTYEEWIASYPRDFAAYGNLANMYVAQGQYEKALEALRETLRLVPVRGSGYGNLVTILLALQRFEEAQRTIQRAQDARMLDDLVLRNAVYALAFLHRDAKAMEEQRQWFVAKPAFENFGASLDSDTEAYLGHLNKAEELTKRSIESAVRVDSKETGATWQENAALREGAFGNLTEAQRDADGGLKLAPTSQGVEIQAALAFAIAHSAARAEFLARDLDRRYPLDTQVQHLWLPAIQARLALNRKNSAAALNSLKVASTGEFGQVLFLANISCLYPTYVRGEAYLAAGQGNAAAAEFQTILDHSGIVWNCWTGALAHLGVARANALQARTSRGADGDAARSRALAAYKDFLTLWKDADQDIPIFKQAKAEYANLQ